MKENQLPPSYVWLRYKLDSNREQTKLVAAN